MTSAMQTKTCDEVYYYFSIFMYDTLHNLHYSAEDPPISVV